MTRRDGQLPVRTSGDPGWHLTRRGRLAITATVAAGALAAVIVPNAGRIANALDSKPEPGCELLAPQYLMNGGKIVQQETGLGKQPVPFGIYGLSIQLEGNGDSANPLQNENTIESLNPDLGTIYPGQTRVALALGPMCTNAARLGYQTAPVNPAGE